LWVIVYVVRGRSGLGKLRSASGAILSAEGGFYLVKKRLALCNIQKKTQKTALEGLARH